jgi:hypothetical protein
MIAGEFTTWAGVEYSQEIPPAGPPSRGRLALMSGRRGDLAAPIADEPFLGRPADDRLHCANADPFEDFDDDDFDDEFDDDFEEEWDEELPGDADQFEPDEKETDDDAVVEEPEFEDED